MAASDDALRTSQIIGILFWEQFYGERGRGLQNAKGGGP